MVLAEATPTEPILTLDALTAFLTRDKTPPPVLGPTEFERLDTRSRIKYNEARANFMTSGELVARTSEVQSCSHYIQKARKWNQANVSDRSSLTVSGAGVTGKSTALKVTMDEVFKDLQSKYPDLEVEDGEWIPIAYIEVPSHANAWRLLRRIADFLTLTYTEREPTASLLPRVVRAMRGAHTEYVVIDEAHLLTGSNRGHSETVEVMRELQRSIVATFAFGGVHLPSTAWMTGDTSSQLTDRTFYVELVRYPYRTSLDQAIWRGVIESIEEQLPLYSHPVGTLEALDEHLHFLTSGSISSLKRVIGGAALDLLDREDPSRETITEQLLDEQPLDMTSEKLLAINKAARARATRKAG